MEHISLRDVHKALEKRNILNGVDLTVEKGEILAIVGPSGSGKSTLLRCLNRLVDIDKGEISLSGNDISSVSPPDLRRCVSLVHQEAIMLPGTVQDNVSYGLRLQDKEVDGRVEQALSSVGLSKDYLLHDAEKLSGGERQRVALARSMILLPEALLLDEPTASVDPRLKHEMEQTIISLAKESGVTALWVTHDVEQAKRVADRIAGLKDGKITTVSSPVDFDWEGAY